MCLAHVSVSVGARVRWEFRLLHFIIATSVTLPSTAAARVVCPDINSMHSSLSSVLLSSSSPDRIVILCSCQTSEPYFLSAFLSSLAQTCLSLRKTRWKGWKWAQQGIVGSSWDGSCAGCYALPDQPALALSHIFGIGMIPFSCFASPSAPGLINQHETGLHTGKRAAIEGFHFNKKGIFSF